MSFLGVNAQIASFLVFSFNLFIFFGFFISGQFCFSKNQSSTQNDNKKTHVNHVENESNIFANEGECNTGEISQDACRNLQDELTSLSKQLISTENELYRVNNENVTLKAEIVRMRNEHKKNCDLWHDEKAFLQRLVDSQHNINNNNKLTNLKTSQTTAGMTSSTFSTTKGEKNSASILSSKSPQISVEPKSSLISSIESIELIESDSQSVTSSVSLSSVSPCISPCVSPLSSSLNVSSAPEEEGILRLSSKLQTINQRKNIKGNKDNSKKNNKSIITKRNQNRTLRSTRTEREDGSKYLNAAPNEHYFPVFFAWLSSEQVFDSILVENFCIAVQNSYRKQHLNCVDVFVRGYVRRAILQFPQKMNLTNAVNQLDNKWCFNRRVVAKVGKKNCVVLMSMNSFVKRKQVEKWVRSQLSADVLLHLESVEIQSKVYNRHERNVSHGFAFFHDKKDQKIAIDTSTFNVPIERFDVENRSINIVTRTAKRIPSIHKESAPRKLKHSCSGKENQNNNE